MYEPPEELRKAISDVDKNEMVDQKIQFDVLGHGETLVVEKESTIASTVDVGLNLLSPDAAVPLEILESPSSGDHEPGTAFVTSSS